MSITVTKRIIAFIFMLAAAVVPTWFINGFYGYFTPLFLIFAVIMSFIYMVVIRSKFSCSVSVDTESCHRGDDAMFTVSLINRSPLVLMKGEAVFFTTDGSGRDFSSTDMTFAMGKKKEQEFSFTVRFAHIGIYSAGVKSIYLYDMFGLFRTELKLQEKTFNVSVLPHIADVSSLSLSDVNTYESVRANVPSAKDGMDYRGIRAYAAGDPIKQIHWKLSAHMTDYVTKVMETYTNTGITVILDMTSPECTDEESLCIFDTIIESGISVVKYAEKNGIDCDMVFFNKAGELRRRVPSSAADEIALLQEIPEITAANKENKGARLLTETGKLAYGSSNVVICTGFANAEMIQEAARLKQRGKNPEMIIAVPSDDVKNDERSELLAMLDSSNMPYILLKDISEL